MEIPIDNIKHVSWNNGKIYITYKDGTKFIGDANDTVLIADYKNNSDIPLNDHCL